MISLSWQEVMFRVRMLAGVLKDKKVYGIPRAGTLVAVLLSYHECKLITRPPPKSWMLGWSSLALDVVIVDDIADSGETLKKWSDKGFSTAALFTRRNCATRTTYHINSPILYTDEYIMFPWEKHEKVKELEESGVFKDNVRKC